MTQWINCHNPYFSGLSFATMDNTYYKEFEYGHNPYFSGLSFATYLKKSLLLYWITVTILILVDFLLQRFKKTKRIN